jgi:hypothetical protein
VPYDATQLIEQETPLRTPTMLQIRSYLSYI